MLLLKAIDAIKRQQPAVHSTQWEEFNQQTRHKFEESWLPTLQTLGKHTSSYNESLGIKLDLYRCVSPQDYNTFSKTFLQKVLCQINDTMLLKFVT